MHYEDRNLTIRCGARTVRRCPNKDIIMKSRFFENGLAILGALIIIVGVSAAANTALAGNMGTLEMHRSAQK